jgi:Zn-dependent peptidase ImmA (M78 family)
MPARTQYARQMARKLIEQYSVKTLPVPIERMAKQEGLKVQYAPFDDELSGMTYIKDDVPIIGVNSLHHPNRQRFTLAHELGHVILHRAKLGGEVHVDRGSLRRDTLASAGIDDIEIEANAFASELLMPQPLLEAALSERPLDLEDDKAVATLAKKFRVSDAALRFRLQAS